MIYLIFSLVAVGDNLDNLDRVDKVLKIGYCGEESKKSRIKTYLTENPGIRVLHLIPGGTPEDERNLHVHFRHLKKPYGREWFEYCKEILDFFESHTTQESLQELNPNIESRQKNKLLGEFGNQVNWWINSIMSFEYLDEGMRRIETSESLVNILLYNRENMEEYIKTIYSDTWESIYKKYQELSQPLPPKINEYLDHFNKISQFPDKLKYIYEVVSIELDIDELNKFLNQIPQKFKDYFSVFSPSLVKSMSYRESLILKEWDRIKGNSETEDNLIKEIYQEFQVNSSYSNFYIKEKLKKIYESLEYKKSPKAVDIKEYFETKDTKITVDGKRSMGFKLLKKKVL